MWNHWQALIYVVKIDQICSLSRIVEKCIILLGERLTNSVVLRI